MCLSKFLALLHCRLLASKAAQALLLLRTIAAANINRLVNRLDNDSRRALMDLVRIWWYQLTPDADLIP